MNVPQLVKNTVREFSEDDATTLAASIAYSAFFSIFPLLLGLVALAARFIESPDTRDRILGTAISYLPGSADFVQKTLTGVMQQRGSVGLVSAVLLLVSGRGIFTAVVHALDVAFETKTERNFIASSILAFEMIFGVGGLMLLSLIVTAVLQALASITLWGYGPYRESVALQVVQGIVTIAISIVMFMVLYKFGPNMPLAWREVLPGAILAAVLFEIAKWGFVIYVKNFTNYEAVYGTIGAVIALLTWCYFSSIILLLGAELSSEYTKLRRAERRETNIPRPAPTMLVPVRDPATRRLAAIGSAALAAGAALAAVIVTRRAPRIG